MALDLTNRQLRQVYQALVEQDPEFLKALAVCVIQDGISIAEDMALDMTDQENVDHPITEQRIKGIGLSVITDQLSTLADDLDKAVTAMPLAFKAEMVLTIKNVAIG